jgi:hypothetical protein
MSPATRETDLLRSTLRTVALLVGACVLFVGVLSVVAVAVTRRAVDPGATTEARSGEAAPSAKKPLSI